MEAYQDFDASPSVEERHTSNWCSARRAVGCSLMLVLLACSTVAAHGQARRTHTAIETDSATSLIQMRAVKKAPLHSVGNFIAALGSTDLQSGSGADKWGLWEGDPGSDGRQPSTLASNAPAWYKPHDWWLEEHGMVMPNPKPLPAGQYMVYGDITQGGAKLLTIKQDGSWELPQGVKLDDVVHHPCKAFRYMGTDGSGCSAQAKAKCSEDGSPVEYPVLIVSQQSVDSAGAGDLPKP